ncbi:HEAT repeat domain-containing protein [Zavarzinella formosa]|uniref:HEAT repeat domain-containing protein n=1 Tax=Zavarzinella formosa TaxID=360055 RepID=UPI0012F88028|nr:HEAT repeat domain-containing protein [Zavarzinella formosa]
MTRRCLAFLLLCLPGMAFGQDHEEAMLRSAGLPADSAFLIEYLKQRTRDTIPADELNKLLEELGAEATAGSATAKLVQRGPSAIAALRRAKNDAGNQILGERASKCLALIEGKAGTDLTAGVLKLATARQAPGATETILAFAPHAEDSGVLDVVGTSLVRLAYPDGKSDTSLANAITNRQALIRMLAAEALARADQPATKRMLVPLLSDPVRIVRQRAAIALCKADEILAVPVLVELLATATKAERVPVEETLQNLAGETGPKGLPVGDDPVARQAVHQGWEKWWKKVDGPGLLDEFRTRTLHPEEVAGVRDLVRKLGDENYRVREKATEALGKLGAKALPFVREAAKDMDGERSRRAEECVIRINSSETKRLPSGIPRLTALRRPVDAIDVMLAYVPFIDDDEGIINEIRTALSVMALDANDKPDSALLKALNDPLPSKRSLAAEALCRGAGPGVRPTVKKLLADPVPAVRQTVGIALVGLGDKDAVPVLIDLLGTLPANATWPTQDTLQMLAGETTIPPAASDSLDDRRKHRNQWADWWKASESKIDVAKLMQAPGYLGYTLLVQVQNNSNGRVIEIGRDGKIRWKIENLRYPVDAFMLPGERVLITEWDGNKVTEYDTRGNIIWKKEGLVGRATNANRLASGNTFISTTNELLEVDKAGKEVYKIPVPLGITAAYRAANGDIVCLRNDSKVVRYNTAGNELKTFDSKRDSSWTSGLDLLRNGNILVTQPNPSQKVTEYTPDGKQVFEWSTPGVTTATRLTNGNLLAASHGGKIVIEYDRGGKKVWEYKDDFHIFRARRR